MKKWCSVRTRLVLLAAGHDLDNRGRGNDCNIMVGQECTKGAEPKH